MSIEQKVHLVESLFTKLEQESAHFEQSSGLTCISGCGQCCTHPSIEASPIEFLPLAFHLFLNGEAEKTIIKINKTKGTSCLIYKSLSLVNQGRCSNYVYRGLICRLFGYSANSDKYGKLRLATCKIVKEDQTVTFNSADEAINKGLYVPVITEYYMQLNQIDFTLGNIILPINKALKMALEQVLQYYAYRPILHHGKKCC